MTTKPDPSRAKATPEPLFAATRWSVVLSARDESTTALNQLFTCYRAPLIVYLRKRRCSPEVAEDLVHGLFEKLIRLDFLKDIDPQAGKFRTFLLTSLQNYLKTEDARQRAKRRGGGVAPASIDETDAEGKPLFDPASPNPSADREYDKAWAHSVLQNALRQVQEECAKRGREALFRAVEPVLYGDPTAAKYAQIAAALDMKEGDVKIAVFRIRNRLGVLIRREILQTVRSPADLKEELSYLIGLFGR